jgi:hypothetical protein
VKPDAIAELLSDVSDAPPSRAERDQAAEALALAAAALPAMTPAPAVRARLLDTLASSERFAPFLDDLTRLFELPAASVRRLLARVDAGLAGRHFDGPPWERSLLGVPLEGAELFHFAVGPTLAATGAAGGAVRIGAGVTFPRHRHNGAETSYVLQGGYCLDDRVLGPGSVIEMAKDSEHDYRSAPGRDLVLMILHRGITMLPG